MEKYYFILHSRENGTWMITPSFPTGDYVASFVNDLKQDGIRIYDYDVYSEETRKIAKKSLQHAKDFYDRTFQFTIEGEQIEVTPLEILQYYKDGYNSKNEPRCAKVVAGRKFIDMDCMVMADEEIFNSLLKYGDSWKEDESMRFKFSLWNMYIIRKKGKFQIKAYQSGSLIKHIYYAPTKEKAVLYCLNGFNQQQTSKETIMATEMTKGGVSTCQVAGTEKYEKFSFSHKPGKTYIQYDYRDTDGTLFAIVRPTLEECRSKRDEWLQKRKEEQK